MTDFNIEAVADKEDYEFIKSQSIPLVRAIEADIKAGKAPEEIRDFWNARYKHKRDQLGARIYFAARHILRERTGGE